MSSLRNLTALLFSSILAFTLIVVSSAQVTPGDNVTSLAGTWSTGSGGVSTGLGFFNPVTQKFTMPKTSGISFSFTDDGFFEEARFRYNPNPVTNRCFNATLIWQHGTYESFSNGSLVMTPFGQDGFIQIMAPCADETVQIYGYNEFMVMPQWENHQDNYPGFMPAGTSAYAMTLWSDDGTSHGAPMNIMWLQSRPPTMLPTQQLFQTVLNS